MPILMTDIRYQILQNWIKVDAQKLAQKMAEVIDISNIELDPPKIIINTITDAGSQLAGSDVVAIAQTTTKEDLQPMEIAPNISLLHEVVSTQPPKNESIYDRIKRLNEPLTTFCEAKYYAARYA